MIELTLEDLKQLLLDGRRARQYAWDHYEELAAREAAYTLYGPYTPSAGAAIPWGYTPKRARNLSLKTRRKDYIIYELDSEYKLLRVRLVLNSVNDYTYHCFELDGVQYFCPFLFNRKKESRDNVVAMNYKDGKPYSYALLSQNVLFVQFCEYVSPGKALMTEYAYNAVSEYTVDGYPTDPEAPIGALNSAATRVCWEEEPIYTDFSKYFRETEMATQNKENSVNQQISNWIDTILKTDMPDNVVAVCFNLYEEGGGEWSMELVGSDRFDLEDEDWPCYEITNFNSRKNPYKWEMEYSWEEALAYMVKELRKYLENGKYAELIKSRTGVGVGFVDGNIEILYSKR